MRKKFRKILGCLTLLFLLTSCGGMTNSSEITKLETKETQQEKQQTNKQNVEKNTCTVSIECSTILDNEKELKASKKEFVPSDGWILEPIEVKPSMIYLRVSVKRKKFSWMQTILRFILHIM